MDGQFHADFHGFVIDSEQGLSFAGKPVHLHPKELKLLQVLVKNAGKRVSKEELATAVWNNAPVSDESISRCLSIVKSALRRASPGAAALIKTEYGLGYRFIGQVCKPASFVNEENFFLLINASSDVITLKDSQGRWQIANNTSLIMYGLAGKPWQGKTDAELAELCSEQLRPYIKHCGISDRQAWQSGQPLHFSGTSLPCTDGQHKRFFDITKTPLFEEDGSRKALVTLGVDITDRIESERQNRLTSRVLANSDEAILISDASNRIVYVNEAFTRITGYTQAEVFGENPRVLSSRQHDAEFYKQMWRQILDEGYWHGEIFDKRKNGDVYPKWLNISCVHENDGSICNFIGIFSDLTKRKADEALLAFLAYHDPLTKLANRLLLRDRFQQALGVTNRRDGGIVAILFLDLDKFKNINDSLGHEIGDRMLIAVAKRLQTCIREIDTVSRLGGDEFVIVLTDVPDSNTVSLVAQKILDHLNDKFEIEKHRLSSSASIGIALYPNDGEDFDTLIKVADTAMYHAKDSGRNTYRFYTDKMNIDAMDRLRLRNGLAEALVNQEFVLHYQPMFDISSNDITGVEALIRWNHPEHGLISPGKFLSVAEETGQIVAIGEWVICEAYRQAKAWQQNGYQAIRVAVNLSSLQFKRGDVLRMLIELTDNHALDPRHLELEITESVMLQDVEYILDVVDKLKSLSFTLSLDNFGTGYSSLAYLKRFRVDKLKIDQSFIRNLEVDHRDVTIVRSIIQLADGFGLRTIAEGVETPGQLEMLRREGCNEVQGYLFSHPLPADQVVKFLNKTDTEL